VWMLLFVVCAAFSCSLRVWLGVFWVITFLDYICLWVLVYWEKIFLVQTKYLKKVKKFPDHADQIFSFQALNQHFFVYSIPIVSHLLLTLTLDWISSDPFTCFWNFPDQCSRFDQWTDDFYQFGFFTVNFWLILVRDWTCGAINSVLIFWTCTIPKSYFVLR
jgi:hypothetical protein